MKKKEKREQEINKLPNATVEIKRMRLELRLKENITTDIIHK